MEKYSSWDFIVSDITFSYSSTSSYRTCPYGFKLAYIDLIRPRLGNFFSDYGLLTHDTFEQFFLKKLKKEELTEYFLDNWTKFIVHQPPAFLAYLTERYRKQAIDYFNQFDFNLDAYEVLLVEGTILMDFKGYKFTARPDLVIQEKFGKEKIILWDYKTSLPWRTNKKTGKEITDIDKLEGYKKQMYIYANALERIENINCSEITLVFPRGNREYTFERTEEEEQEVLDWLENTIVAIRKEEDFPADTSSKFFCDNLCGVRNMCEYR